MRIPDFHAMKDDVEMWVPEGTENEIKQVKLYMACIYVGGVIANSRSRSCMRIKDLAEER